MYVCLCVCDHQRRRRKKVTQPVRREERRKTVDRTRHHKLSSVYCRTHRARRTHLVVEYARSRAIETRVSGWTNVEHTGKQRKTRFLVLIRLKFYDWFNSFSLRPARNTSRDRERKRTKLSLQILIRRIVNESYSSNVIELDDRETASERSPKHIQANHQSLCTHESCLR